MMKDTRFRKSKHKFFNELGEYFETHSFIVDGKQIYDFHVIAGDQAHAYIWYVDGVMINLRLLTREDETPLHDICVYLQLQPNSKRVFDKLFERKDYFEERMGYKLVWDRNNQKKACRIGRFGKYAEDWNCCEDGATRYDFNLDVEKVAEELVRFYHVFVPEIKNILYYE